MPDASPRNPPITEPSIRLAVCVSGGGTTLQNLIDRIGDGRLNASIVLVVASKPGIGAIERAERAGIPVVVIPRAGSNRADFSRAIFEAVRERGADLVILGGFLCLISIPGDYVGRVLNVHPSLVPAFSGKGYHGAEVHRSVLDYGAKVSGCTVHFADDQYDTGPVVLQRPVPVLDEDTPETLAARVFEAECEALPEAVRLFAEGRLVGDGRRVRITRSPV